MNELENYYTIKEIHYNLDLKSPLVTCEDSKLEKVGDFSIFHRNLHEYGFEFIVIELVAICEEELYEITMYGTAYFDGVRHIRLFPYEKEEENGFDGYSNYPNLKDLSAILSKIHDLELSICNKEFL